MIYRLHFWVYTQRIKNRNSTNIPTAMFTTALFTAAIRGKQPQCPRTDEWINKMRTIHAMEYYSIFKREKILRQATTWVNLRDLVLSKTSPSHKDKYSVIPLEQGTQNNQVIDTENRMMCTRSWGLREEESVFNGYRVLAWKGANSSENDGDVCTIV